MSQETFFDIQLSRNKQQISNPPRHWSFIKEICNEQDFDLVYDIGCGVGAISKYLNVRKYLGLDYSEVAVKKAIQNFGNDHTKFIQKDFLNNGDRLYIKELISSNLKNCILQSGFLDVLEDGDEGLENMLRLQVDHVILMRVELIDGESYNVDYFPSKGYKSFKFYHNKEVFNNIIEKWGYKINKKEEAPVTFPESGATGYYMYLSKK